MRKFSRRLAALGLSALMLTASAMALTPDELGTILRNEYVGQVPEQVWDQTTVEGMLEALGDPFSRYYTAQAYAAFQSAVDQPGGAGSAVETSVSGGVGTMRVHSFGTETYDRMARSVTENRAVEHWIVDLRGCPGGELRATADALSVFAGGGELIYLRDRAGTLYSAKSDHSKLTIHPAIVLVDGATASAAELYAGGIRDRQAGLVIGSRTYGKGVAQSAFDQTNATYGGAFADGSALLLTTEKAFSDNLASPNMMGVLPHLAVEPGQAEAVARLLCAQAPSGDTAGYLRLHLARWRWYVELKTADKAALKALLEALPPQALLYVGYGGEDHWRETSPADVAAGQGIALEPRTFADVENSPYADAILPLRTYGIVQGDGTGNFRPAEGLDRASLCALLAQAMHFPQSAAAPAFADTPADAWYTPYVTTLSALGIVNGYGDGLFHPNDPITHQQFMTVLARIVAGVNATSASAMALGPDAEDLASGQYAAYDDWAVTSAWLLDGAWHAPAVDIDPRAVTTREEAAYDLWSALSTMGLLPA